MRPRGIFLGVELSDDRVAVEVRDCGGAFPCTPASAKRLDEGGRGMSIIAAIMDQLEVAPDAGRTRVRFAKRLALA